GSPGASRRGAGGARGGGGAGRRRAGAPPPGAPECPPGPQGAAPRRGDRPVAARRGHRGAGRPDPLRERHRRTAARNGAPRAPRPAAGRAVPERARSGAGDDADRWSGEVLHQRPDGSAIPVHLTVTSLRARSRERLATVLIARDVSDEKRQQAQLMESDRLALVGGLVSAVAHELNNPLAAIGNFAELLRADEEDPERKEMLETIAHEAARAGRTVRNLLSFSRPSRAARAWVRLSEVVDRTVALRIYDQRRRRIEVGIDIPADLPPLWADANQLQ